MKINREKLKKYCELSTYYGGHDAMKGLTKKGRAKFFKNNFKP